MTKPSHSGLIYYFSLLPQTLCSRHTELHLAPQCTLPSPSVISLRCCFPLRMPSLSLLPRYTCSHAIIAWLTSTHISGAREGLSFPRKPFLTPSCKLRWPHYMGSVPSWHSKASMSLFTLDSLISLRKSQGQLLCIRCFLDEPVNKIDK